MSSINNVTKFVPKFMKAPEFADYTGLPYHMVLNLIKTGKVEGFRSGKKTHYILVESYRGLVHSMTPDSSTEENVPQYLPAKAFAKYTGLPYQLVLGFMKTGELEALKSGGKTNYILTESYRNLAHSMATQ